MKSLAVFCGSRNGASPAYMEGAKQLGKALATQNITLVYGGSSIGMMGTVANSVLENGGKAIGVMPHFLDCKERSHNRLTELIKVNSMHERKAKMSELADGFITLPGGAGTLEEFFEIFTWAQLGLHQKPLGLLNINHYYDPLVTLLNHMTDEEFMDEKHRSLTIVNSEPIALLDQFKQFHSPDLKQYINKHQT